MGKIDLTYINKQIAAKKAAEVQTTSEAQTMQIEESKEELFGETYEQFKSRLDREFDEAMAAIRAMKELGI